MKRKLRPLLVVSRFDPNSERALSVCVPCTTQVRGGNYEVALPRAKWLPSDKKASREMAAKVWLQLRGAQKLCLLRNAS